MKKTRSSVKQILSSWFLTLLFLLFIFYVGAAAFPEFLESTLHFPSSGNSLREYIQNTDQQYKLMLPVEGEHPLLRHKGTYINFNGFMAKLLNQPFLNERVKLKNGHLSEISSYVPSQEEIASTAQNIARIALRQQEKGKHFLFVLAPSQISKYEDLLPGGYTDTTNDTADRLLDALRERNVPVLDLREKLHNAGMTHDEAFFATDHHWTPETGFWAYTVILDALSQMNAIAPVDSFYTDAEQYDFKIYPSSFLGTSGVRTGQYYAGLDDFCVITPKFETDISVDIPRSNEHYQGSYEVSVNNHYPDSYYLGDQYFEKALYGIYGRSDTPPALRLNPIAPQAGKFLLMGDSFTNVPFSFFSLYMQNSQEIDMRDFEENFQSFYDDYDPDTVVMLINSAYCIHTNTTYPFFPE